MLNEEQIRGKWTEIKGGVRNLWGRISDEDLERVKGNFQEVAGMVQERYGETKESIRSKLDKLMASFDNETDKSMDANTSTSYERNPTGIRTSSTSQIQDEAGDINTRGPERDAFESNISFDGHGDSLTRDNNMKSTGGEQFDRNARH